MDLSAFEPPKGKKRGWKPDPTGKDELRFWDGKEWTGRVGRRPRDITLTPEERREELDKEVKRLVNKYYRVESQTEYQAVLVEGRKVNHILHLLLTIFTLGLWLPVWLAVAILGGERRKVVTAPKTKKEKA